MRIIAGTHRGRNIISPTGPGIRPTSSKMRAAMFDILISNGYLTQDETKVVDLCCGTGALGLEALSRGVKSVVFIDASKEHLNLARQNIYTLGEEKKSTVLRSDAMKLRNANEKFDLVFIDPPYNKGVSDKALITLSNKGWLSDDAIIVVEMDAREELKFDVDVFKEITTRPYGNSKFIILRHKI
jgi:16S rRNA (guanine966-N2)-methyltransferase